MRTNRCCVNWRSPRDTPSTNLLDDAEKIAGAVAAVETLKHVDNAPSILTEGAAAIAGFEGTDEVKSLIEKAEEKLTGQ